jgi:hypothetical protein
MCNDSLILSVVWLNIIYLHETTDGSLSIWTILFFVIIGPSPGSSISTFGQPLPYNGNGTQFGLSGPASNKSRSNMRSSNSSSNAGFFSLPTPVAPPTSVHSILPPATAANLLGQKESGSMNSTNTKGLAPAGASGSLQIVPPSFSFIKPVESSSSLSISTANASKSLLAI